LKLYAKIGTHSSKIIKVGWKRKPPKIGDFIKFKDWPPERYAKWETGIVDEIRDTGSQIIFFIERF